EKQLKTMEALSQLHKLIFDGGFDERSRKKVKQFEDKLHELTVKENLKDAAGVKEWYAYLTSEWQRCHLLLATDRTLTELQRESLHNTKDICNRFLSIFDSTTPKQMLEQEIESALSEAKHVY